MNFFFLYINSKYIQKVGIHNPTNTKVAIKIIDKFKYGNGKAKKAVRKMKF